MHASRRPSGDMGCKSVAGAASPVPQPPRRTATRQKEGVAEKTGARAHARARTSERGVVVVHDVPVPRFARHGLRCGRACVASLRFRQGMIETVALRATTSSMRASFIRTGTAPSAPPPGTAIAPGKKAERPRTARRAGVESGEAPRGAGQDGGWRRNACPRTVPSEGVCVSSSGPALGGPEKALRRARPGRSGFSRFGAPPCPTCFSRTCRTSAPLPRGRGGGRTCCPSGWRT